MYSKILKQLEFSDISKFNIYTNEEESGYEIEVEEMHHESIYVSRDQLEQIYNAIGEVLYKNKRE